LETVYFVFLALLGAFALATFFSGLFTVDTAESAVIQRFGKFVRVAGPGLNFKMPWIEQVAGRLNLRL